MQIINKLIVNDQLYQLDFVDATYYDSLEDALEAALTDSSDKAVAGTETAVARVYMGKDGRKKLQLLQDISLGSVAQITGDLDLLLNGHTLTLTTPEAYLQFAEGTVCTLDGTAPGSTLVKQVVGSDQSASLYLIRTTGAALQVLGGQYRLGVRDCGHAYGFYSATRAGSLTLDGCRVEVTDTDQKREKYPRCVYALGEQVRLKDTTLKVAGNIAICISNYSRLTLEDCRLEAKADELRSVCVESYYDAAVDDGPTQVTMRSSLLQSHSEAGAAYGMGNGAGCIAKVENCRIEACCALAVDAYGIHNSGSLEAADSVILADAPDDEDSRGIYNTGTAILRQLQVDATHSGVLNTAGGKLYVSGGVYTGFSHGGFYFAHGAEGEAFVNDAVSRCDNYRGSFTDIFPETTPADYGSPSLEDLNADPRYQTVRPKAGVYVGGGSQTHNSNVTAYLDGCTIGQPRWNALCMRGTDGEQNCRLYMSNCTVYEDPLQTEVRIDSNHRVFVGLGCNVTADMTNAADRMEMTDGLYRCQHPDAVLTGKDYRVQEQTLAAALDAILALQEELIGL